MKECLYGLCILALILSSCKNDVTSIRSKILKIDSVTFDDVPYNTLSCYDNPVLNGERSIAINNSKNKSIVLFNNTGANLVTISYANIKGLSESYLRCFDLVNYDSIFLQFNDQIAIIDSSGNLKYAFSINQLNTPDDTIVIGNIGGVGKINWSEYLRKLFVGQYPYTISNDNPDYYKIPVIATWDIQNNRLDEIPVYYPDMYLKDYYGDASYCFNEQANDDIITGFLGSTDLEIYNIKTQKTAHITHQKSRYDTLAISSLNQNYKGQMDKIFEHLTISPLYTNIVYDPYNDGFYRFFVTGVKLKNEDGTYNGYFDKDYVLMLFDKDFNLQDEVFLGKSYLTYYSFIMPDGLYIMTNKHTKSKNENRSSFTFNIFKPVSTK
ncbi:MAG: DUF4221 family protein [Chitinophagales bacterium]|nr:DUF4221 family protein [Chitinophagales bacterium]